MAARRSGKIILESSVDVGGVYRDAGAIAVDDVDGDVSGSVSRSGLSLVSTRSPTAPGEPYVVKYSAQDRSGNIAEPTERHVRVLCSDQSLPCSFPDGATYCSISATKCVEPAIPQATGDSTASVLPTIKLIGPAEVEVLQGTPYGACRDSVPVSVLCDRGATAHSVVEGDITWVVMACSDGFSFQRYGLQGCGVDTGVVGRHTLTFFVMHGDEEIAVSRTLWVLEACQGASALNRCYSLSGFVFSEHCTEPYASFLVRVTLVATSWY
jgi:hypothetical protein